MNMTKWEYWTEEFTATGFFGGKLDMGLFQDRITQLGSEGWEMVGCFDTAMSQGATRNVFVVFKRPY